MGQPITPVEPTTPTVAVPTPGAELLSPRPDPGAELDRQIEVLVTLGWADLLGTTSDALRAALAPLHARLPSEPFTEVPPDDLIPFLLVVPVDVNDAVPAMRRGDRRGVSVIGRTEAVGYRTVEDVTLPDGPGYLLTGVDTGSEFCNLRPADARTAIAERGRSPLTMTEGIALATVRPDMLRRNRCFSLLASRAQNQRVPAIWISERRAKLGWCWDRNPHTWLGAASTAGRVGTEGARPPTCGERTR